MDRINDTLQNAGSGRITAENMALLCNKNVKLDIAPIQIPDITVPQIGATELAQTESVTAAADQPPASDMCRCMEGQTDNRDNFCMPTTTLRGNVSMSTDVEAQWLARYPCIDRVQLAELREAFLMFAVDAPEMTPRMAAIVADSATLDAADLGTCLRAVGQNPTEADIARITAIAVSHHHHHQQQQQQQQADDGGGEFTAASNMAIAATPTPSNRPVLPTVAGSGKLGLRASDMAAMSRRSAEQMSPAAEVRITMDDYLCAVNAYSKLTSEKSQVDDVQQAFEVFDDLRTGYVSRQELRAALTTLGERLTDDDVDAMMAVLGDDDIDSIDVNYKQLIDKLASV